MTDVSSQRTSTEQSANAPVANEQVAGVRPQVEEGASVAQVTPINDLGPAAQNAVRYSPKYGIPYQDNGFNPADSNPTLRDSRLATMASSIAYFRNLGIPESVIADFKQYATDLLTVPNQIGMEIDTAYETIYQRWNVCGGKYASTINSFNRTALFITVQPSIWYQCGTTAGCNYIGGLEVGNKLYTTIVYVSVSYPSSSRVTKFRDIVRWEMGNAVATYSGHRPKTVSQEMGDKSPCGQNVGPSPLPPPAPKNLVVKANSPSQVGLTWTSGGGSTSSFYVAHAEGSSPPKCTTSAKNVTSPAATMDGLKADTQYAFTVCAANSANALSAAISGLAKTPVDQTPLPPKDLVIKPISPSEIALEWKSGGGSAKTFYISHNEGTSTPACALTSAKTSNTTMSMSKLKPDTEYSFSVCSANDYQALSAPVSGRGKTFEPCKPVLQNKTNNMDVNNDGVVSSLDVLLIMNHINTNTAGFLHDLPAAPPFLDVNGDCYISPADGLLVINQLNKK
jgi:hypothetical protein